MAALSPIDLGPLGAIPDGGSAGFRVPRGCGPLRLLAVRRGGRVFVYVNRCPHTGGPLDWVEGRFLSFDKAHIQCATHGALFRIEDGFCLAGPCAGDALSPVAAKIAGGRVVIDP